MISSISNKVVITVVELIKKCLPFPEKICQLFEETMAPFPVEN